jgi:hypothetical protein
MRKLLVLALCVSVAMLLFAGPVVAGRAKDNCGCGLGTVLWGDKADNSILSQSMQATTNGTFGNQTFGITSGTSECDQPPKWAAKKRLLEFVNNNMDNLAKDIAVGQGESHETLAELMEIPGADRNEFYGKLQSNFDYIFATGKEEPATILDRIVTASS